jgi:predicted RNase H-like nuclease
VYVGVDGYPRGWVAVALDQRGRFADAWVATTLELLLDGVPVGPAVGVDIPLGLLEAGWRTADRETAQRLGARRSSVFAVPPRPVWSAIGLAEANRLCRRLCDGGGFSVQAWGLRTKVLEADAYRELGQHELIEVHPELAFAGLAGAAMAHPKKSWNGQNERRRVLAAAGVRLPDQLARAGTVPVDDLLDAGAVAWCTRQCALGCGVRVPEPPDQFDRHGRPIVIHG